MIDYTEVANGLQGLVGWEQNSNPDGLQLTGALTASRSGLTYNRHPLLDVDNILAMAPNWVTESDDRAAALSSWMTSETLKAIKQTLAKWWTVKAKEHTAKPILTVRNTHWYDNQLKWGAAPATRLGLRLKPFPNASELMQVKVYRIGLRFSSPINLPVYLQRIYSTTEMLRRYA